MRARIVLGIKGIHKLAQKTCLLTGSTSGIGQAAAISLAQDGYELFLVARSPAKAKTTETQIKDKTPEAKITWLMGDLSKQIDVRKIAQKFLKTGQAIDLLFLNAGICYNKRRLSEDGYEMMLAVNHLAPFLLTQLIYERLLESPTETRVVITASGAYKGVKALNLTDMNFEQGFKTFSAYGNSKLCNILFTQVLADKLQKDAPHKTFTVNCFHPGFVGTGIGTQVMLGKILMALVKPFVRNSAKGAETGLFLAKDISMSGKNGGYYFDCQKETLKPYAKDKAAALALWNKSLEMISMTDTSL